MDILLASELQKDSIVDGEGLRAVIWTQGCPHHCFGCHNEHTHSFKGGYIKSVEDLKQEISELKGHNGITLSGGEPLMQITAITEIAKYARSLKLNVWCYTGFTYEQIEDMITKDERYKEFLNYVDVLIDGKFMIEQKSLNLKYRGSKNQRIINVKKTLKAGHVCTIKKHEKETGFESIYKKDKYMFT